MEESQKKRKPKTRQKPRSEWRSLYWLYLRTFCLNLNSIGWRRVARSASRQPDLRRFRLLSIACCSGVSERRRANDDGNACRSPSTVSACTSISRLFCRSVIIATSSRHALDSWSICFVFFAKRNSQATTLLCRRDNVRPDGMFICRFEEERQLVYR